MGLRSTSGWEPRKSSTFSDNSGLGLTPAQERMSGARSPVAGNVPNEVQPKDEWTAEKQYAQDQQQQQQKEQKKQQQQQQQNPVQMATEQAASKLTTFADTLRAKVNKFLTNANVETGATGEYTQQYVLNPATGQYELKFVDNTMASTEAASQQKIREQRAISRMFGTGESDFASQIGGMLNPKEAGQIVEKSVGGLDPAVQGQINSSMLMLQQLENLSQQGLGNSPEAKALEQQLQDMDSTGAITQLRKAREDYNALMGKGGKAERWYSGTGGESYSAMDLAKMDNERVKQEVEKALTFSSGLFGGDFSSNLKSAFDHGSTNVKQAQAREAAIHSELQRGFDAWAKSQGNLVKSYEETLGAKFKDIAQDILYKANLDPDSKEGALWMQVASEGGNALKFMTDMISDPKSGLGTGQRNQLKNLMNQLISGTVGNEPAGAMYQLARTGQISIPSATGEMETFTPTGEEKLKLMNIMNDRSLTTEERNDKLKSAVGNLRVGQGNLNQAMTVALAKVAATGVLEAGAENQFKSSMLDSLKTFVGSKTEDGFRRALIQQGVISEEEWKNKSQAEKNAIISQAIEKMTPEGKKNLAEQIRTLADVAVIENTAAVDENIKTLRKSQENMKNEIDRLTKDSPDGTPSVISRTTQNLMSTLQPLINNVATYTGVAKSLTPNSVPPELMGYVDRLSTDTTAQQYRKYGITLPTRQMSSTGAMALMSYYSTVNKANPLLLPPSFRSVLNQYEGIGNALRTGGMSKQDATYYMSKLAYEIDALKSNGKQITDHWTKALENPMGNIDLFKDDKTVMRFIDTINNAKAAAKKLQTDMEAIDGQITAADKLKNSFNDEVFDPTRIVQAALNTDVDVTNEHRKTTDGRNWVSFRGEDGSGGYGSASASGQAAGLTTYQGGDIQASQKVDLSAPSKPVGALSFKVYDTADALPVDWGKGMVAREQQRISMAAGGLTSENAEVRNRATQTVIKAFEIMKAGMKDAGRHIHSFPTIRMYLSDPTIASAVRRAGRDDLLKYLDWAIQQKWR